MAQYEHIVKTVERAIEHIKNIGADDIFRPPFFCDQVEFAYLQDPILCNAIKTYAIDFLKNRKIKSFTKPSKFAVPKNAYAYRNGYLIDIDELVCYTALVLMAAESIEAARIPKEKRVVFSYRYNKTGQIYSSAYNYKEFRKESALKSKQQKYKVKIATDIANFYDRLNLHRLESSLADVGVDPKYVRTINELLIHWADRNSYGLPVGCDASRLLAECSLISVDNALVSRNITFVRYVDDYRIFAKSFAEAHSHLHYLIEALDADGLFINTSKTVYFDISEKDPEDSDEEKELLIASEFEKIDTEEKKEGHKIVKVGYVSKIVKYYRKPGEEKIKQLKKLDITDIAKHLENCTFEKAEDSIKLFVQAFVYQGALRIDLLKAVAHKYIHSLTYIVDALVKEAANINDVQRGLIKQFFVDFHDNHKLSPYYRLTIHRLLSDKAYLELNFISKVFGDLKLTENEIYIREFILRMRQNESRDLMNKFRSIYEKSHLFVRRAIFSVYLDSTCVLEGEKRAWLKNIAISEKDTKIKNLANRYLNKSKG